MAAPLVLWSEFKALCPVSGLRGALLGLGPVWVARPHCVAAPVGVKEPTSPVSRARVLGQPLGKPQQEALTSCLYSHESLRETRRTG